MTQPAPPTAVSTGTGELSPFRDLVGRTLGGRYRVVAPLGRGGAGQVFTAVQEPLGREVALKVLRTDLDDVARHEFEARFLREAALLSRLRHPHLVAVFDYGAEADLHYVIMEKLAGRTLRQALRAEGPLPAPLCARLGAQLARGLRHAHQAGLVHRDVKPNNVILEPDDDGVEHAKLIDFGLVKETGAGEESSITRVGAYLGTPAYMSPEQARGAAHIDGKADVYALGVLLYQALTGRLPFDAETALGLAVMHSTEPYPPMAVRAPDVPVPAEVEAVVRACLEKDPASRPDVADVAVRLEAWLVSTEASAPLRLGAPAPASPPGRSLLPWLMGGVAAVAAIAVTVGGGVAFALGWTLGGAGDAGVEVVASIPTEGPASASDPPVMQVEPVVPVSPDPSVTPTPPPPPEGAGTAGSDPAPPSRPAASPRPTGPVTADGVTFGPEHARRALDWLNVADKEALLGAGIAPRQVALIQAGRPYPSLEAFASTPQIGEKTVAAVASATGP
jgi:serine/threonine-protein kinase